MQGSQPLCNLKARKQAGGGGRGAALVSGFNGFGGHRKPHQLMLPEGAQEGHIGGIAAAGNQHPAGARDVVPCIEDMPAVFEKHLKPGGEIHGRLAYGDAGVAEVAGAVAGGDIEAAAEGDGQVGEIAAHPRAIAQGVAGALLRGHRVVVETDVLVHPVTDCLHLPPAGGHCSKCAAGSDRYSGALSASGLRRRD